MKTLLFSCKIGLALSLLLNISSYAWAGSWSSESISGMNVQIYTPTSNPARNNKRALMINLHGCAQTNSDLKNGGNWKPTADKYGMVIAIPNAPGGGVIAGCWDYYGNNQTRSNKYNDNLIGLANTLKNRNSLNIDANQVYISGLSSGSSQSMVVGCLAPEIFAGLGLNAGPTIGTSSGEISSVSTSLSAARNLCNNFAGSRKSHFSTQITSAVYGSSDYLVSQGYNQLNIDVMGGVGNPRTTIRKVNGMGHEWPAGGGPGGSYINNSLYNYPEALTTWLCNNNRRAGGSCNPTGGGGDDDDDGGGDDDLYCGRAKNIDHYNAGRAIRNGVPPYENYSAKGSYQWLAYPNTYTRLQETSAGYFVKVSSC
ncbi:MAG: PHB depolymerase family esterase [Agarilytica sp.]